MTLGTLESRRRFLFVVVSCVVVVVAVRLLYAVFGTFVKRRGRPPVVIVFVAALVVATRLHVFGRVVDVASVV